MSSTLPQFSPATMPTTRTALFVDIDNFVHCCLEAGREPCLDLLLARLPKFSDGFSCGDIASLPDGTRKYRLRKMLASLHIRHEDMPYMGHKNSADMRLTVAIIDTVHASTQVGVFVLITGDRDFIPVANYLRARGKFVIGVGPHHHVSPDYVSACDQFHSIEDLLDAAAAVASALESIDPNQPKNVSTSVQPAAISTPKLPKPTVQELTIECVISAIRKAQETEKEVKGGNVASALRFLFPDVDLKAVGGLKAFCLKHPDRVRVEQKGNGDYNLYEVETAESAINRNPYKSYPRAGSGS